MANSCVEQTPKTVSLFQVGAFTYFPYYGPVCSGYPALLTHDVRYENPYENED